MAFVKKTWKGRQGTGLNKFSIGGATPVTVINQPDLVTEQGDALSAGNLNDLENRIYTAFEDEATARDDADTALKAAIAKNTAEIENLKQTTGQQEITVSYPDDGNYSSLMPNKVPLSVANYAEVLRFRGKSRAWNQLVIDGNFSHGTDYVDDLLEATVTASNNVLTVNCTGESSSSSVGPLLSQGELIKTHVYFLTATVKSSSAIGFSLNFGRDGSNITWIAGGPTETQVSGDNAWHTINKIGRLKSDASGYSDGCCTSIYPSQQVTYYVKNVNVFDLTLIFGAGNEPSTVEEALALLPSLGQYNAYDAGSLVDTTYSAVKSVGVNLFNEQTELGDLNGSNGADYPDNNRIRTEGYNWCGNSRVIYAICSGSYSGNIFFCFYDKDKNFIASSNESQNSSINVPYGACYFRFSLGTAYGTTYKDDIQIADNDSPTKTTYHAWVNPSTLTLPSPVTLRSAGSVADELGVETGEIKRNVGNVDLGDFSWSYITNAGRPAFWLGTLADAPLPVVGGQQICAGGYLTNNPFGTNTDKILYAYVAGGSLAVAIRDSAITNSSSFSGMMLNYELATSTTEQTTPVLDPFLKVEGGGTIRPIQTQTPVLDNCLDVTYDVIPQ